MVAVVGYIVRDLEDRFACKVGFRDKHDVGIGVVEKLDEFGFMVLKSICVLCGDSNGVISQKGIGYL